MMLKRRRRSNAVFLTLSAVELGKVAVLIIKGIGREHAIRRMPRYSPEQHEEFSLFYEQVREGIEEAWKEE